jgi:hypothetical protein
MTDRNKFEEMLERLVNEDRAGAEELFHEIVVEKSREIYQSIIEAEEEEDEEVDEAAEDDEDDEELDEASYEDEDDLDEMFGLDEFAPGDGSDAAMGMGGDATDDMMGDIGMDDGDMDDDDMGDEDDVDNRLADLEDALEELKAEFDALMSDEEGDEDDMDDMDDMDMDMDDEADDMDDMDMDDEADDMGDMDKKESFAFEAKKMNAKMKADAAKKKADAAKKTQKKTAGEEMREYVEKVGGQQYNQFGKMGDNGSNSKSIVAGKNDMGGSTQNIVRGDTEAGVEANKGQLKGSSLIKQKPQDMRTGNVNVPGGNASKSLKGQPNGHGAEKKGAGETADKGARSMLNGATKRAR